MCFHSYIFFSEMHIEKINIKPNYWKQKLLRSGGRCFFFIMWLFFPPGILVDSTSQYAYVFFACSITGSTAGLFIMLSFYWLDRQKCRELKTSFTHKDINSLKPSTKMTLDCDYSPVPLHANNIRDMETDVWCGTSVFHHTHFVHSLHSYSLFFSLSC